ncbi:ankyrin repeat and SOCS box protein 9-like [Lineus longissimus]|uniref:ankyrin repeat and SOCS box protein 9-like n=1 Tax=Lineus longissimus TaxID=88925 RepID=UPI002B4C3BFC
MARQCSDRHDDEWHITTSPRMSDVFGILSKYMEPEEVIKAPSLHQAICSGDYDKVVELLCGGDCDVNQRQDQIKPSPLYCAAYHGHNEILALLLQHESISLTEGHIQLSELHAAVYKRHMDTARLLLQHGTNINARTPGNEWTALHIACFNKQAEMIELLLEYSPKVNSLSYGALIPISLIFMSLNEEDKKLRTCRDVDAIVRCLEALLRHEGMETNHWSFHPGLVMNILPLEQACRMREPEMIRLLLNSGARADGVYHRTIQCVPLYHLYRKPEDDGTLFFQTTDEIKKFWECVVLMLDHGIDQDVQQNFTRTLTTPVRPVRGSKLRLAGNVRIELSRHSCPDNLKNDWMDLVSWLDYIEKNPSTLKNLCRRFLRRHLNHKVMFKVDKLPLPKVMKDYVLMRFL